MTPFHDSDKSVDSVDTTANAGAEAVTKRAAFSVPLAQSRLHAALEWTAAFSHRQPGFATGLSAGGPGHHPFANSGGSCWRIARPAFRSPLLACGRAGGPLGSQAGDAALGQAARAIALGSIPVALLQRENGAG
jgi:hypothetical protein